MIQLNIFELQLPLTNPVLLFSLILFIILFAPIILNKFKIPHLIGLIIAGAIIGPHGFNLMLRDSSIILFGTVGLLYIMFLAGLEIDLAQFKKNSGKSLIFGMFTFLIPMILGTFSGIYLLNFSVPTSLLLASMFASHTLIAYPIVSKFGVSKNRAVNIAVGGTLITDTLALLVLAVIARMSEGDIDRGFWIQLGVSVIIFGLIVIFLFPIISRWFFKRFNDNISQYIFVLGMVFLAAFLAEAAGVEPIIGAFLAGLSLNRLIPHTSALMNRIEFVGNALFIPFFLIGVGMLINYKVFFVDKETVIVALIMIVIAIFSKFLAAFFTQKTFRFTADERRLIFGLSNARAAGTLAVVLVGYNIIIGFTPEDEPIRLLNESVLNGTILMILVTCTVASFATQKGARNIAIAESTEDEQEAEMEDRILIPITNISTTDELINMSVTLKAKSHKNGLYALHVIDKSFSDENAEKNAKKILDKAEISAASTDHNLQKLLRYDINLVNGISNVVKEHKITDILLGLHQKQGITDSFLGDLAEGILAKCNTTTLIYKSVQPLSTIKRHIIIIPEKAEKEVGFPFWLIKIWNIAKNTGSKFVFYATEQTLQLLKEIHSKHPVDADFIEFLDWDEFLILAKYVKIDDNLIIVLSRKNHPSYNNNMAKVPSYLNKYFKDNNFILIYPIQSGIFEFDAMNLKNSSVFEPLKDKLEKLDDIGKTIAKVFKWK